MTALQSEIIVSGRILPEKEDTDWFLTLTGYGETYDEVRKQFALDEEVLKESVGIRPLSVDEAVKIIFSRLQGDTKEFSYASFVRSKKNLYDRIKSMRQYKTSTSDPNKVLAERLMRDMNVDQLEGERDAKFSQMIDQYNDKLLAQKQQYANIRTQIANENRNR